MYDEEPLYITDDVRSNQSSTSVPNQHHQINNHQAQQQQLDPVVPTDEEVPTFFVRALYDYRSTDTSSLCFTRGAVIEVLSQMESGWWDGLLGGERGWFPRNYVDVLSEEELEAVLAAIGVANSATAANADTSTVDLAHIREYDSPYYPLVSPTSAMGDPARSEDLWISHVTRTGQVFFFNTRTGERASEIPTFPSNPRELALRSRGMVFAHNTEVSTMGRRIT